ARLVAALLPVPRGCTCDRRGRPGRRRGAAAGPAGRAVPPARRAGADRRSVRARDVREEAEGAGARRLAGDRRRTADRGLMRAVNLLPANASAPKQRLPHAPVVLAATVPVLAGALVYLGYSLEHSQVVDRQTSLGVVQSQIAELGPSPELVAKSSSVQS